MRPRPSAEAILLAMSLFSDTYPLHAIAEAFQELMDERDLYKAYWDQVEDPELQRCRS